MNIVSHMLFLLSDVIQKGKTPIPSWGFVLVESGILVPWTSEILPLEARTVKKRPLQPKTVREREERHGK